MAGKELDKPTENIGNQNEKEDDIIGDIKSDSSDSSDQNMSFTYFHLEILRANFLLKLRENYGTTEASCFLSDKVIQILYLETKSGMQNLLIVITEMPQTLLLPTRQM